MAYTMLQGGDITPARIQEMLDLERSVYDECGWQTVEHCVRFLEMEPGCYRCFVDDETGRLAGNLDIFSVTDDCYERMRAGELADGSLEPYMMDPSGGNGYFAGVTIRPEHRGGGLLRMMLRSVDFTGFDRVLADAVTPEGARLCVMAGFERIRETGRGSVIYERTRI